MSDCIKNSQFKFKEFFSYLFVIHQNITMLNMIRSQKLSIIYVNNDYFVKNIKFLCYLNNNCMMI